MAEYRFHEMGDFYVNSHAVHKADNCWAAFVFFERRGAASNGRAPGMRHHLPQDFETESLAIEAGIQHAADRIRLGDTGL